MSKGLGEERSDEREVVSYSGGGRYNDFVVTSLRPSLPLTLEFSLFSSLFFFVATLFLTSDLSKALSCATKPKLGATTGLLFLQASIASLNPSPLRSIR